MNYAALAKKRLKKVLINDKNAQAPPRLTELIKSDMVGVLTNYMEIRDLQVDIEFDEDGICYVKINAATDRLKPYITVHR